MESSLFGSAQFEFGPAKNSPQPASFGSFQGGFYPFAGQCSLSADNCRLHRSIGQHKDVAKVNSLCQVTAHAKQPQQSAHNFSSTHTYDNAQLLSSSYRSMPKYEAVSQSHNSSNHPAVSMQALAETEGSRLSEQQRDQQLLCQEQLNLLQQGQAEAKAVNAALACPAAAAAMHPAALYGMYRQASAGLQQLNQAAVPAVCLPPQPTAVSSHSQQPTAILSVSQNACSALPTDSARTSSESKGSAATGLSMPVSAAQPVGRWSGPIAVMTAASMDPESVSSSCCMLDCDEDPMFSLGDDDGSLFYSLNGIAAAHHSSGLAMQPKQPALRCNMDVEQVHEEAAYMIEDSGSTAGDSAGCLEQHTGVKEEQDLCPAVVSVDCSNGGAAAIDNALLVIGAVAAERKGTAVLAAGAESVRSRMLITEVSVYMDRAANSQMALDQANKLMSKMTLPGGVEYMPVSADSFLFKAGAAWQFPAFVICLGSSYLQRMLGRLPQLAEAALACPGFEDYSQYLPDLPAELPARLRGSDATVTLSTLRSIQFTCLFLATKVADQIHALGLLRFMLTNLSHSGAPVSLQQSANVEAGCLEALEWRLGPFFMEDELSGADEALWAESMGHWDYGTSNDTYPEHF